MAKQSTIATKTIDFENGSFSFDFSDGRSLSGFLSDFSPEVQAKLALDGIRHKVGDSYAGAKTVGDAYDAAQAMLAAIKSGDYRVAREGGGAAPTGGVIVDAIVRFKNAQGKPTTREAELAKWLTLSPEQRSQVSNLAAIKVLVLEIKREKLLAQAGADEASGLALIG